MLLASLDIAQSRRLSSFLKYAVSELNSINGHLGQAGVGAATRFRELRALNENADDFLQRVALQYGLTRGVLAAGLAQLHQAIAAATDLITRFNEEPTAVRHLFTAFTSAGPLVCLLQMTYDISEPYLYIFTSLGYLSYHLKCTVLGK